MAITVFPPLAAWFGPSAHGLVSKQLETLGVEEPADLLELDSDDLAGLEGAMKKVQAKKFARNLEKMAEAAGRPLPKRPTAPPPRQPQHAHSARGAGEADPTWKASTWGQLGAAVQLGELALQVRPLERRQAWRAGAEA